MTRSSVNHRLLRRITGNFAWAFVSEGSTKGAVLLVTLHLAAVLGVQSFGVFSFVLTVFTFMWMGVDLGLGMYGTREIARGRQTSEDLPMTLSFMRGSIAILIGLVTAGVVFVLQRDTVPALLALSFCGYLLVRAFYVDWYLRGLEEYRTLAAISVVSAAGMIVSAYFFLDSNAGLAWSGLPWFVAYTIGSTVIWIVIGHQKFGRHRGVSEIARWSNHWRESVHFTLSNGVSTIFQNLPLVSLYLLGDAFITGEFAAPYRLVIAAIFVMSILPLAMYPVIAEQYENRARGLRRMILLAVLAVAIASVFVAVPAGYYAEEIVMGLFGLEYSESVGALRILLVFFVLRSTRAVLVRTVCAAGFQRDYSLIAMASVVVISIFLIGAPLFDTNILSATCWALAITELLVLLALGQLTMRVLDRREEA